MLDRRLCDSRDWCREQLPCLYPCYLESGCVMLVTGVLATVADDNNNNTYTFTHTSCAFDSDSSPPFSNLCLGDVNIVLHHGSACFSLVALPTGTYSLCHPA